MLKYLLRFDQVDDRGCQASIFTEGPGSARQPGRRPRRSTAWCSSCSLQVCGRLLKPTGTVLRQVGHFIHVYYIWSNLMQSMAEECFELTFSSKVCEATNTISDEPTPKLDSAIETMCRKTGEVMRQLVKHEILQKWGVLWVPRWIISSCITNKITSPNQPNIWMPLCNNVFWHFFRGWGGYNWRQSCDKSTHKLSTTVEFCHMSTVDKLTVCLSTVYFFTSPMVMMSMKEEKGGKSHLHAAAGPRRPTWLAWRSPGVEENCWFVGGSFQNDKQGVVASIKKNMTPGSCYCCSSTVGIAFLQL